MNIFLLYGKNNHVDILYRGRNFYMSSSTKKQNRILLISLTAILAATAVLIAVTGSANKKKAEALPAETVETVAETKKTSTETKKETEKAPENSSTEEVEEKSPERP